MKALVVVGLFLGTPALGLILFFVLLAGTTPDQSDLDQQVDVTVLRATDDRRASSVSRFGFRVEYAYEFGGATYVDEQFVPLKRWEPGRPLGACINPSSSGHHTLHLTPKVKCGTYIGTEQTAALRKADR